MLVLFSYSILSHPLFYFSPLFLLSSFYFFPLLFFPLLSPPFYSCPLFGHPQKPINLQAELRAFFLFITRSGHVCRLSGLDHFVSISAPVCEDTHLCICVFCPLRLTRDQTQLMTALTLSQTPQPTTGELAGAQGVALINL